MQTAVSRLPGQAILMKHAPSRCRSVMRGVLTLFCLAAIRMEAVLSQMRATTVSSDATAKPDSIAADTCRVSVLADETARE